VTESLAYAREGRWDEFLGEWYLAPTPTVGQWCHYIPPVQVVVSETETLSLTASAISTASLQLAWTPADDRSAIEYWLYGKDPNAIGWRMDRVIPLNESTVTLAGLDSGDYRYVLVARNDANELIARSNEVTVTIAGAISSSVATPLLLPFVMRN
jgi:hypothetical protein